MPYQVATQFIKLNGKGPVLDVGAGTGLLGIEISKFNKIEMHATDISEEMLSVAEKKGIYSKSILGDLTKGLPILDNTYCPTKVDKQLGGPFLDFWPIRPIKKINGASPQPPNTHWKPFNLI